jgi:hypothetical protein
MIRMIKKTNKICKKCIKRSECVVPCSAISEISRLKAELARARGGQEGAAVRIKALRDLLKARDTEIVELKERMRLPNYPKGGT